MGTSIQRFVDSVIFLLISHPYDVGDSIYIDNKSAPKLWVTRIQLYTTTFADANGREMIVPNHILAQQKLINIKRGTPACYEIPFSGESKQKHSRVESSVPCRSSGVCVCVSGIWDCLSFLHTFPTVGYYTTTEMLMQLQQAMQNYVTEMPDVWVGDLIILIYALKQEANCIQLALWATHVSNLHDGFLIMSDATELTNYMRSVMGQLGITYSMPDQPVALRGEISVGGQPVGGAMMPGDMIIPGVGMMDPHMQQGQMQMMYGGVPQMHPLDDDDGRMQGEDDDDETEGESDDDHDDDTDGEMQQAVRDADEDVGRYQQRH